MEEFTIREIYPGPAEFRKNKRFFEASKIEPAYQARWSVDLIITFEENEAEIEIVHVNNTLPRPPLDLIQFGVEKALNITKNYKRVNVITSNEKTSKNIFISLFKESLGKPIEEIEFSFESHGRTHQRIKLVYERKD